MSTQQGPSVASLGTAILLLATGGSLLASGAAGLVYRGQVGAQLALHGHVVAAGAAVLCLLGLTTAFAGVWLSSRSAR